jgi:hypothetical protein
MARPRKYTELDRLRGEYNKTLVLEVLLGLVALGWFFAGLFVNLPISIGTWLVVLIVLFCLDGVFEYRRKRLTRKIDTAEGVIAARGN